MTKDNLLNILEEIKKMNFEDYKVERFALTDAKVKMRLQELVNHEDFQIFLKISMVGYHTDDDILEAINLYLDSKYKKELDILYNDYFVEKRNVLYAAKKINEASNEDIAKIINHALCNVSLQSSEEVIEEIANSKDKTLANIFEKIALFIGNNVAISIALYIIRILNGKDYQENITALKQEINAYNIENFKNALKNLLNDNQTENKEILANKLNEIIKCSLYIEINQVNNLYFVEEIPYIDYLIYKVNDMKEDDVKINHLTRKKSYYSKNEHEGE